MVNRKQHVVYTVYYTIPFKEAFLGAGGIFTANFVPSF